MSKRKLLRTSAFRRQAPVKGGREQLPSCVIGQIKDAVERTAQRYQVSRSFVIAVALADQFGIREQETFYPDRKEKVEVNG